MSDIEELFKNMEADLSGEFDDKRTVELWGTTLGAHVADMTIKSGDVIGRAHV